ncbi:hypothetical protein M8J77_023968 [Diaphorina citri]|nr:hypothetical protein M8J77_023968 [Diaphorina citri]
MPTSVAEWSRALTLNLEGVRALSMAAPEGKEDPGPLGLCGGYLLLIIGEPHSAPHKNIILSRIKAEFVPSKVAADCMDRATGLEEKVGSCYFA